MITRSFVPLQVVSPSKKSAAEDEHWAAGVEYTVMRESAWHELAHWKGFVLWVCVPVSVAGRPPNSGDHPSTTLGASSRRLLGKPGLDVENGDSSETSVKPELSEG